MLVLPGGCVGLIHKILILVVHKLVQVRFLTGPWLALQVTGTSVTKVLG
jgi:hypothetical protein